MFQWHGNMFQWHSNMLRSGSQSRSKLEMGVNLQKGLVYRCDHPDIHKFQKLDFLYYINAEKNEHLRSNAP